MKKYLGLGIAMLILAISSFIYAFDQPKVPPTAIQRDPYGYPVHTVSFSAIRRLLLHKEYARLNALFERYQQEFERDFRNECKVYDAYYSFTAPDSKLKPLLDEWVSRYPNTYQSHLARAFYLEAMGWERRGYGWGNETSQEQFEKMCQCFSAARQDIDVVLKLNPKAIGSYCLLIEIDGTMSADREMKAVTEKALKRFPYSFLIRSMYLDYIRPIWGGTYGAMDQFAEVAQAYVKINPRLRLLEGFSYFERGWRAVEDRKNYLVGFIFFKIALLYGEYWDFYIGESDCYLNFGSPDLALKAMNRSIELNPQSQRSYAMRAQVYYKLGKYAQSVRDVRRARQILPNYVTTRDAQSWITRSMVYDGFHLYKAKKYNQAIGVLTWATKMDPGYAESYYWRGQCYAYQQKLELALHDYEKSIKLDPKYFYSYLSIDWVLCHYQQWDKIIAYWNQYIALQPNDGRAYRERGGTYYHKGDLKAALADAKKAGELGDAEGRRQYERLKNRVKQHL